MTTDAYQPCPCGIDKKIKFCCGSEVLGDLAKVEEALQGEQRLGALDLVNRLLAADGNRPCLHMYKAMVQFFLKEPAAARQTVDELMRLAPGNPAGLALSAMLECFEDRVEDAVELLQGALEAQQGKLVNAVYEGLGVVGRALLIAGEPIAAQAHLILQTTASQGKDRTALMSLLELEGSGQIPLSVHGMLDLLPLDATSPLPASDVPEFNAALRMSYTGAWLAAANRLEKLAEKWPLEPAIWRNIGVLRARLINNGAAVDALRKYSLLPGVPRDIAVEAESLAQFLNEPGEVDFVAELTATFNVTDAAALKENLTTNKRIQVVPFDPQQFQEENEPPPQAVFFVLDREVPATAAGLTRDNIPHVVGEALLYGKQTDRDARIEFSSAKTADYEAKLKALREAVGSFLGDKVSDEVSGKLLAASVALTINWRFPDETPDELRQKMIQEHRTQSLLSVWPNLPMSALDGKTPRVAVIDPAGQIRVQALILGMDLADNEENPDFNRLRRSLGLPTLEPIEPVAGQVANLTPAQQTRLVMSKLTDDDLVALYRRAVMLGAPRLVRKLALEVVARPSLDKRPEISRAETYDILSRMASTPEEAIAMLLKAQEAVKAQGQSPARFLLAEFPLRLRLRQEAEAQRVLNTLMTKHIREPGVGQALTQLLTQLGLLQVDPATGQPVMPKRAAVGPIAAPATPSSGLWTPDQAAPPPPAGKSKLWVPGME
ncbi:MAG: hypothetical protein SFU86_23480 [Pirellulaceae bacterium]|nr:hypothetical protein [Pirellulaceae bacterium]